MSYSFALQTMCFHLNLACMFMGVEQQCARLQQLHMSCVFHAGFKFRWIWIDMVAFICSASGTHWMNPLGLQFLCFPYTVPWFISNEVFLTGPEFWTEASLDLQLSTNHPLMRSGCVKHSLICYLIWQGSEELQMNTKLPFDLPLLV
jgi:hypothetical protein